MGHSFKSLVYETGGGFKEAVKAVHVGGPLGGIVPTHKIDDLTSILRVSPMAGSY